MTTYGSVAIHAPCLSRNHNVNFTKNLERLKRFSYSLFRLPSYDEAMVAFSNFSAKLLPLYHACPRFTVKEVLQSAVDALNENKTWSCAHLAAFLQLGEAFRHDLVAS